MLAHTRTLSNTHTHAHTSAHGLVCGGPTHVRVVHKQQRQLSSLRGVLASAPGHPGATASPLCSGGAAGLAGQRLGVGSAPELAAWPPCAWPPCAWRPVYGRPVHGALCMAALCVAALCMAPCAWPPCAWPPCAWPPCAWHSLGVQYESLAGAQVHLMGPSCPTRAVLGTAPHTALHALTPPYMYAFLCTAPALSPAPSAPPASLLRQSKSPG